jgi:hypothetical protein
MTATTADYRDLVGTGWPAEGHDLLAELAVGRGRYALVATPDQDQSDALIERMTADLGLEVARLGSLLADRERPPTLDQIGAACADAAILADLDLLFWPDLHLDPLAFLADRSRRLPTTAVWPGTISGGRASYSQPGRPDYYDGRLADCLLLAPRARRYPDEVPFVIERIAR